VYNGGRSHYGSFIMQIVVYLFSACFLCMSAAMMFAYSRTRHYGLFLIGLSYGAAAILAVISGEWWPLLAGFVIAWLLRVMGLDPDAARKPVDQPSEKS
jgi:hypothetical protein